MSAPEYAACFFHAVFVSEVVEIIRCLRIDNIRELMQRNVQAIGHILQRAFGGEVELSVSMAWCKR